MGCAQSIDERQRNRHQRLNETVYVQPVIDNQGFVVATQVTTGTGARQRTEVYAPGDLPPQYQQAAEAANRQMVQQVPVAPTAGSIQGGAGAPQIMYVQQGGGLGGGSGGAAGQVYMVQQQQSQGLQSQQLQGRPSSISASNNFNSNFGNQYQQQLQGPGYGIMSYMYYQPQITNRPPPTLSGRQRALLIGCNYFGTRAELKGCITDCKNIFQLLTETFNWSPNSIRLLTDDRAGQWTYGRQKPTKQNILNQLRWLANGEDGRCRSGDVMFLLFSGHGAQKEDPHGYEEDGMNETILPIDFQKSGMITDDELADICVRPLPEGARLTCLMDSCHSGTGLDLPYTWTRGRGWREDVNPFHCVADIQMFSGCEDDQTSSDGGCVHGQRAGAMTTAFCDVTRRFYGTLGTGLTYSDLLNELHRNMVKNRFSQRPMLTSSQAFDLERIFILDGIVMNTNKTLGRTFRKKFPPKPRRIGGDLGGMLGLGAGLLGGLIVADVATDLMFGGGDMLFDF